MKYSLRSLMIVVMVLPPLLAWGWWRWESWRQEQERKLGNLPWLVCPAYDFADDDADGLTFAYSEGRLNYP